METCFYQRAAVGYGKACVHACVRVCVCVCDLELKTTAWQPWNFCVKHKVLRHRAGIIAGVYMYMAEVHVPMWYMPPAFCCITNLPLSYITKLRMPMGKAKKSFREVEVHDLETAGGNNRASQEL